LDEPNVTYSFSGDPSIDKRRCPDCGSEHESVTGFVLKDASAHAVYYADWYPHRKEAYVDVVLGPWEEPDYPDQVTFGCRLGPVEGQDGPAASLVTGGENKSDHPLFGVKLDREAALEHPMLAEFWDVIDWLVVNDPTLNENVYHMDEKEEV
jgi:hypothetical protein